MIKKSHSLIVGICILFMGGVAYIIGSVLSHDAGNAICKCILCTNNRLPEEGEYIYNHYLFVLSIIWITFLIILGYVVKERAERNIRKHNKRRNR